MGKEIGVNHIPDDIERVLITTEAIQARVKKIAAQIDADYADVECIYLIGILKGAFIFLADLARELKVTHVVDFMAISSYGKSATSGTVRLMLDVRDPIENQHVVIVEDIIDTGQTLNYLYRTLKQRKPASLRTCVLFQKVREGVDVPINYVGFEIPDVWVVGYGLDYADTYRTLPYIAELKASVYQNEGETPEM
jgi:hypoxanthine phosphoribosyltransferase